MHHQLRKDEQGQCHEEAHMHLDVHQEGHSDRVAPRAPTQRRQDQQRQPQEERDDDDPATQELQPVAGEMSPADDLVQRSTEDQREVVGVLRPRVTSGRAAQGGKETGLGTDRVGHDMAISKTW